MDELEELRKRLLLLPKGYLSRKTIKGRQRFYLQRREGKKVLSTYVPNQFVEDFNRKLSERKDIEGQLEALMDFLHVSLAKEIKPGELTGSVMMGDREVVSILNGKTRLMDSHRAPLFFLAGGDLKGWLSSRSADSSRRNLPILKDVMGVSNHCDEETVIRVHACSITDNYWFKPKGSRTSYDSVRFKNDLYADVSLFGDTSFVPRKGQSSPELTNTGSFEKCWRLHSNHWYLEKIGDENALFSEWFSCEIAYLIGVRTARYEIKGNRISCPNLAERHNMEPLSAIAGEDDSYAHVYHVLEPYGKDMLADYLRLCYFDCLVANVDRHNGNISIYRDKKTGALVSLAPNYDCNIALLNSKMDIHSPNGNGGMVSGFLSFLGSNKKALGIMSRLQPDPISVEQLEAIASSYEGGADVGSAIRYILINQENLLKGLTNLLAKDL